ncbi:RNA-binding S4 domain-containing protein [Lachnospiraceae bacterium HCP1S3_C3]|nr:RNA-binding S4 domain-containing protein [Lachnospiraceae bacterium]MDD6856974.1 RNA-binding S4 domain-containing protein [Lachnospiraceae bacterium]
MEKIILREEYIKLGQALKAMNLVESGVEAKIVIVNGEVKVNGETEYQRGKKLRAGDIIEYNGEKVLVSED